MVSKTVIASERLYSPGMDEQENSIYARVRCHPSKGIQIHKRTLVFDRPFVVLLCNSRTGAVLFAGVVYDPQP
jgi:hypothetical protein